MNKPELTQDDVLRLFDYDEDSGVVTRKIRTANRTHVGDVVGCKWTGSNGKSYLIVQINKKQYFLHRIIYLHVNGHWPDEIDHEDGNGLNNKLNNLKNVSRAENQRNRRKYSTNSSGYSGVHWHKRYKKWMARIMVEGKRKHLGYFDKLDDAISVKRYAEIKYNFHPNHGKSLPL